MTKWYEIDDLNIYKEWKKTIHPLCLTHLSWIPGHPSDHTECVKPEFDKDGNLVCFYSGEKLEKKVFTSDLKNDTERQHVFAVLDEMQFYTKKREIATERRGLKKITKDTIISGLKENLADQIEIHLVKDEIIKRQEEQIKMMGKKIELLESELKKSNASFTESRINISEFSGSKKHILTAKEVYQMYLDGYIKLEDML